MGDHTCKWHGDEYGCWTTDCGNLFQFNEGGPSDNGQRFCGYCGGSLVEVQHEEPDEDLGAADGR